MEELYDLIKGTGSDEELELYRACFENNGTPRDTAQLRWIHLQNVVGINCIYYAIERSSANIVAIVTVQPCILTLNGINHSSMQEIDILTDKNHRGKGLFTKLAKAEFNDAKDNNFLLVYGFPNDHSAHGFFKKLGWTSFGQVPFLIKPMRASYFFKRLFKIKPTVNQEQETFLVPDPTEGSAIKLIKEFDEKYDLFWKKIQEGIKLGICRDSKFMNWRIFNKPGEKYHVFGILKIICSMELLFFHLKTSMRVKLAISLNYYMYLNNPVSVKNCYSLPAVSSKKTRRMLYWFGALNILSIIIVIGKADI